jgi:hypothetical protein
MEINFVIIVYPQLLGTKKMYSASLYACKFATYLAHSTLHRVVICVCVLKTGDARFTDGGGHGDRKTSAFLEFVFLVQLCILKNIKLCFKCINIKNKF